MARDLGNQMTMLPKVAATRTALSLVVLRARNHGRRNLGLQSQPIEAVEGREFEVYEGVTTSLKQKDLLNLQRTRRGRQFLGLFMDDDW